MSDEPITLIECGPPSDHQCDDAGPMVDGVTDRGGFWCSVTCSVCGSRAIDRAMWLDD